MRELNPAVGTDFQMTCGRSDVDHAGHHRVIVHCVPDLQRRAAGQNIGQGARMIRIDVLHDEHRHRKTPRQARKERGQGRESPRGRRNCDEVKHWRA